MVGGVAAGLPLHSGNFFYIKYGVAVADWGVWLARSYCGLFPYSGQPRSWVPTVSNPGLVWILSFGLIRVMARDSGAQGVAQACGRVG